MTSFLNMMGTTSSPQSSRQPHHYASSWEVWVLGNAWIHAWKHARARNPVFFRVKWPSVVAEGWSLFPPFPASIEESGRQKVHETVVRARFHIKIVRNADVGNVGRTPDASLLGDFGFKAFVSARRGCKHSLILSFIFSFFHLFIHSFHSIPFYFISCHFMSFHSFIQSCVKSFIHSFIHSVIDSLIHTFISFVHSFLHSFHVMSCHVMSFLHSFIHSFTHSFFHVFLSFRWFILAFILSCISFLSSFISFHFTSSQLTNNSYKQNVSYSHVLFFETSAPARADTTWYVRMYIYTYIILIWQIW